jgi:spore photoproduct lyase
MFVPNRILFEKDVLMYPVGKQIFEQFKERNDIEMIMLTSNRFMQHIPGDNLYTQFREGKRTLVVDTKKSLKFQSCKPSAHYQLPLVTGCMGNCEYCYLNTNLGDKPVIRVHANVEDILEQTKKYIQQRAPEITIFEGAATSDPIPVEPYTHSLEKTIQFFSESAYGRFRFVTKYGDVQTLLKLNHNNHTEARFSINTPTVIQTYEKGTASYQMRIQASIQMAAAGYPVGYLVAPVFIYPDWKKEYMELLQALAEQLPKQLVHPITFEVITHRYTTVAKNRILEVFPETELPMDDEKRQYKYGQFGYGKYVYPKEDMREVKAFFQETINRVFSGRLYEIKYII